MAKTMIRNRVLILMVLTVFGLGGKAQTYDSTFYPSDSSSVQYFHNKFDTYSPVKLTPLDTTLMDFEAYNPLDSLYLFYASLGNVGLGYRNLDFRPDHRVGFDYGTTAYDAYFYHQDKVKYYLNPKAYTEIGYVTGAKKEQLFQARHHQRVFKRLAVGIDFSLINSLGTYQRQKSDNTKVVASAQFFSDDLRYGLIANYANARIISRENGGIVYDTVYEQNIETNRSIIEVNLADAENKVKKSGVYLQQYFQLSRKQKKRPADTLEVPDKKFRLKFGRIAHSFKYNRYSQVYSDNSPNLNYYPNVYVDSLETHDSVYYRVMENTLSWSNADYIDRLREQPLRLMFGIKHQLAKVTDSVKESSFTNLIPYGEVYVSPHPFITVFGKASYVLAGDDFQGDFEIYGHARFEILRKKPYKTAFNFAFELANSEAPYFYRHYFSNHFIWNNDFSKVNSNTISAFITQRNTRLGVDLININDHLYFGTDTLPAQLDESVEVFKAYLYQKFVLGKFDVDSRFIYQKASNEDVIRLPELMAYFTVTFNLNLFKGALLTRSGFDIYYFTKYYANAWMPATRTFYLQNEKEIGGYIHADFFLDFNVARTRFFMKLQNILQPLGESNYYQVPHYPLQDLAFKFGLSWRFHD